MKVIKKVGKVFLYIVLGLIVLLFVAGLFIDPIAKRVMVNQVDKAAEGQYSLSLDEVDISILGGNFSLKGVVLETDTTHPETPPIAFLKASEVSVEGVSWLTYLLDQRLLMDQVLLDSLNVELYARSLDSTDTQQAENQKPFRLQQLDIYPTIKDQIDRFRLKDLALNDISLTLINLSTQDTLRFNSRELNLQSDDILIDADKLITDNRAFYATEMDFLGKEVKIVRSGNKQLVIRTDYIKFETRDDKIGLLTQGVNFLQTGTQEADTLMSVAFDEFLLSNLEMLPIQEDSTAHIGKIGLENLMLVNNFPASPDSSLVADTAKSQAPGKKSLAEMSLGESLPEFLKKIQLDELAFNSISYRQGSSMRLEEANFNAGAIVVDENAAFSNNRFLHAGKVESSFDLFALSVGQDSVHVTVAGFHMNMDDGTGSLGFEDIQLKPGEKNKDEMWVDAELGPFGIVGINTRNIPEGRLAIDSIGMETPKVAVNMPQQSNGATGNTDNANNTGIESGQEQAMSLYPAIEGFLESVHLGKFAIIDADITASGMMAGNMEELHVPTIYLQVSDVLVAEGTAFSGDRVLHTGDIALRVEEINLPTSELYTMNLGLFRFSTREQFVETNDFSFEYKGEKGKIPAGADTSFVMSVKNDRFLIRQLDWQALIKDQRVNIGLVRTEGLELYSFTDNNKKEPAKQSGGDSAPEQQEAPSMPQNDIKQIEMPFYVARFELEGGNLSFEELAEGAEESGKASVTDISVAASNITNLQDRLREQPKLPIEMNGKLMGTGDFYTKIVMDMVSDSNLVTIRGQIDTLDITKVNRYTEYTTRFGFESGTIYQVKWDIEADDEKATGTLAMSYEDLMIELSESNNPNSSGVLKNAGAFLANNLVLESDVPPASSEDPEKTEISEEREEGEAFPGYVIQGLISGFMDLMVTIF